MVIIPAENNVNPDETLGLSFAWNMSCKIWLMPPSVSLCTSGSFVPAVPAVS